MLNIDNVRGVVKAKYGLTAPTLSPFKPFENPKGFEQTMYNNLAQFQSKIDWEPSYYNQGSSIPTPKIDATNMQIPNNQVDWTPTLDHLYKTNNTPEAPVSSIEFKTPEDYPEHLKAAAQFKVDSKAFMQDLKGNKFTYNPDFQRKTMFDKNMFQKMAGGIKNFAKNNPNLVNTGINMGLDYIGNQFDKGVYNNKGTNAVLGVSKALSNLHPIFKMADVTLRGANSLLGEQSDSYHVDKQLQSQMGSSYVDSFKFMNEAENDLNKFYGFLSTGSRQNANNRGRQAFAIGEKIGNIRDTNMDRQAMSGNDLNYLRWKTQTEGGWNFANTPLFTKQGGALNTKIELLKSRKFNQVINVDTKQIEEFKEGGKLTNTEWEPVIELFEEWEPEIILEVEEFKDGGKTKEDLETPEIEETTQKNLIPEGALHKNKHHMEHTEGLTQKGIPVIDNDGEQQAEIELDEIIFTLEVTKKLEELYKEGTDEAAIEAGKLLVKEILFNTDDRTGLIAKCEEGGKL